MPTRGFVLFVGACVVAVIVALALDVRLERVSAVLTIAGAIAGASVLYWQIRARPQDDQQWAALLFVASVTLVLGLVGWRYLGGPVVGNTPQGVAAFCGVMIALIVLAIETRSVNVSILKERLKDRTRERGDKP